MRIKKILLTVSLITLLLMLVTSPVMASTDRCKAIIKHTVMGSGVVGYSEPNPEHGFPYDYNQYFEPAQGGFKFWAKCSVNKVPIDSFYYYEVIPGTVKAHGYIWTSWNHNGTNYSINAWVYDTESTEGAMFEDFYGLGTYPNKTSLAYRGFLTEGTTSRPINGYCAVTVGVGLPGGPTIETSGFGLYVDNETWLVLFGWFEEPVTYEGIEIPAALVFEHDVMVLGDKD